MVRRAVPTLSAIVAGATMRTPTAFHADPEGPKATKLISLGLKEKHPPAF